jgi:hypothetical protein
MHIPQQFDTHHPPETSNLIPPNSLDAASCPSRDSVVFNCTPIACPYSGGSTRLTNACTVNLPGAAVTYTVNGKTAVKVDCPNPGATTTVTASVADYLGACDCDYTGPSFPVTCEYGVGALADGEFWLY